MPDDSTSVTISETTRALALCGEGSVFSVAPKNMGELIEFAKLMSRSGPCVRPAFRGNPGACLAIALQAFRTGADPFAVANKAYITTSRSGEEQIGYEAQYIHATINNSGQLQRRLRAEYSGTGTKRRCTIIGYIVGEAEPLPYESPMIEEIAVRNSPLWKSDPDQQLFYYSTRAWARRYMPEVGMGMYTPDEIRESVIDVTPQQLVRPPRPTREEFSELRPAQPEERRGGEHTAPPSNGSEQAGDDLPPHITERELPAEEYDEETGEIAEEASEAPAARDLFWSGTLLYVRGATKGKLFDCARTVEDLTERVRQARSVDELGRLQTDSRRTIDQVRLADREAGIALMHVIDARLAELREPANG